MRYVHSPPSSLIAHIIFPSCMTRASSQLIYAAFYFLLKFKKELKNTTTQIFVFLYVYVFLSSYGSSCCLHVVVKGDVDCKAMFNVVLSVYHSLHEIYYLCRSNRFKLKIGRIHGILIWGILIILDIPAPFNKCHQLNFVDCHESITFILLP